LLSGWEGNIGENMKHRLVILVLTIITSFSLTGCVKQSDYDVLQLRYDELQNKYNRLKDDYEDLNDKYDLDLSELQSEKEELEETVLIYYDLVNNGQTGNNSGAGSDGESGSTNNSVTIDSNDIEAAKQFERDKLEQPQNDNSTTGADVANASPEKLVQMA